MGFSWEISGLESSLLWVLKEILCVYFLKETSLPTHNMLPSICGFKMSSKPMLYFTMACMELWNGCLEPHLVNFTMLNSPWETHNTFLARLYFPGNDDSHWKSFFGLLVKIQWILQWLLFLNLGIEFGDLLRDLYISICGRFKQAQNSENINIHIFLDPIPIQISDCAWNISSSSSREWKFTFWCLSYMLLQVVISYACCIKLWNLHGWIFRTYGKRRTAKQYFDFWEYYAGALYQLHTKSFHSKTSIYKDFSMGTILAQHQ